MGQIFTCHRFTGNERFEKLDPFPILGLRMNFLKDVKRSGAAEQAFTGSGTSGEVLDGPGFVPEPAR